ncbi:MAG: BrnT family toxin [Nitrococcus sp.]|nr:BrnT family toxin [Nitrococcus sp.]
MQKHGIAFEEATAVFADEFARLIPDPDHSDAEDRYLLLGLGSKLRLLIVCHCYRGSDTIRIISVRKATRPEIRQYESYRHA